MTKQAMNSIGLYKGQDPILIVKLLGYQKASVVKELMEHFHVTSKMDLAVKLSLGLTLM